jgi:predicted MFS family arabinose efflux permease
VAVGVVSSSLVFYVALTTWGFAFWMVIPAVFRLIEARAITPSERVGDAQALMAAGRVFGPILGGIALTNDRFALLSIVGASVMVVGAAVVGGAQSSRARTKTQPVQST